MEIRQLRYLVVLDEERHFTRAARRLGIAQPALSQQIRRLEALVGLDLVDRTTRIVRLTVAGEALVAGARRVLREVDLVTDELDALRGVRSGRLAVGVTGTPGAVDVAGLFMRFHGSHPGVELDVHEALTVDLVGMLEAGILDLALVAEGALGFPRGLEARTIATDPLVVIVSEEHAFAGRREVAFRELGDERLVSFHRGATIRQQLEERAHAERVELRVAFETANAQRARSLVAGGLAVGVLPATDAHAPGPPVAVVPLAGESLVHRTAVAVRCDRHPTPAAAAFLALLDAGPGEPEPRAGRSGSDGRHRSEAT